MDAAPVSKEMLRWMTLHGKAEALACVATRHRCVTEGVVSAHMNASREAWRHAHLDCTADALMGPRNAMQYVQNNVSVIVQRWQLQDPSQAVQPAAPAHLALSEVHSLTANVCAHQHVELTLTEATDHVLLTLHDTQHSTAQDSKARHSNTQAVL